MSVFNKLSELLRKTLALRAKGQYKFLIKKWENINDISLAADVLSTDFFQSQLQPQVLDLSLIKSYLVLSPHQDDEMIGAGGLMLLSKSYDSTIDLVYITDGAASDFKYNKDVRDSIEIRNAEAQKVANELGATIHHLGISNINPQPTKHHVNALSKLITNINPDVILIPWLLDSPAKHRMTNTLLYYVSKQVKISKKITVLGYQVHNDLIPNSFVDITMVIDKKIELIKYYESQNNHTQRYDHLALGMGIWNSRFFPSNERKYYEVFFNVPLEEYCYLIGKFYFKNITKTYRGHQAVLQGMKNFKQ